MNIIDHGGYCLACEERHEGEATPDGFINCDGHCGEPATFVEEAGGQHWHLCWACGQDFDIREMTEALRDAVATGADLPAPNPNSAHQAQVRAIAYDLFDRLKGGVIDMPRVRRTVRSCFDTELRRIGLICHGARVKKGSDLEQLLDALTEWALSARFATRDQLDDA